MIDINSDTWRAISGYIAVRVEKLSGELQTSGKTELEYENYRGQLKALRMVIAEATRPDPRPQR